MPVDILTRTIHVLNCADCGRSVSYSIDDKEDWETSGHTAECMSKGALNDLAWQNLKNAHKKVREQMQQPQVPAQALNPAQALGDMAGRIAEESLNLAVKNGATQVVVMIGFGEGAINGTAVRWNGGPLAVRGLTEVCKEFMDKSLVSWDKK